MLYCNTLNFMHGCTKIYDVLGIPTVVLKTHQDEEHVSCLPLGEEFLVEYSVEEFPALHQLHHHVHLESIIIHLQ